MEENGHRLIRGTTLTEETHAKPIRISKFWAKI